MNCVWRVDNRWFATRKEAAAFCEGANRPVSDIIRVVCGDHINTDQLVTFLRQNFPDGVLVA